MLSLSLIKAPGFCLIFGIYSENFGSIANKNYESFVAS